MIKEPPDPIFFGKAVLELNCVIEGKAGHAESTANGYRLDLQGVTLYENGIEKESNLSKVLIYLKEVPNYQFGDILKISGTLRPFELPTNPGQFNEKMYYRQQGYEYKFFGEEVKSVGDFQHYPGSKTQVSLWRKVRGKFDILSNKYREILHKVFDAYLGERDSGLLSAMLLGDKERIPKEEKQLYQTGGASHLLALSGLHMAFMGLILYRLLKRMGVHRYIACVAGLCFVVLYGGFAGGSVSALRAEIMLLILLVAELLGKVYDLPSAVAFAAICALVRQPLWLYNSGFWLSFGAVLAMGYVEPALLEWVSSYEIGEKLEKKGVYRGFVMSLSIYLVTLPVLMYSFYEISLYGIISSILLIPLMALVVSFGTAGGVAGSILYFLVQSHGGGGWKPMSLLLHGICGACLHVVKVVLFIFHGVLSFIGKLPAATVITGAPAFFQVVLYFIGICSIIIAIRMGKYKAGWLVIPLLLFLFIKLPQRQVELTMLDVGQGDSILLELGGENEVLIDGGSSDVVDVGQYRILPALKYKGIRSLEYVMFTHSDADHINGLEALLEQSRQGVRIKCLIAPDIANPDEAYLALCEKAEENGVPVKKMKAGDKIFMNSKGQKKLTCLYPTKTRSKTNGQGEEPMEALSVSTDKNENSLVLLLETGEHKALFMGDANETTERTILSMNKGKEEELKDDLESDCLKNIDILKVGHHGSKTSSCREFLAYTNPNYALISCGKNNRYGHPSKETLERLEEIGATVWVTMKKGAITADLK
ncbi:MAG: DNA internalization-related competence protein ComEC/Rec2 [Lachnospiraceae bacterium]|nr:DNA internalization-related competence protein ComEC/Rec2 [Lachnospiraceae bacterium]